MRARVPRAEACAAKRIFGFCIPPMHPAPAPSPADAHSPAGVTSTCSSSWRRPCHRAPRPRSSSTRASAACTSKAKKHSPHLRSPHAPIPLRCERKCRALSLAADASPPARASVSRWVAESRVAGHARAADSGTEPRGQLRERAEWGVHLGQTPALLDLGVALLARLACKLSLLGLDDAVAQEEVLRQRLLGRVHVVIDDTEPCARSRRGTSQSSDRLDCEMRASPSVAHKCWLPPDVITVRTVATRDISVTE